MILSEDSPPVDAEERTRQRRRRIEQVATYALPVVVLIAVLTLWQTYVTRAEVPHYVLPGPGRVWDTLVGDWSKYWSSLRLTLWLTLLSLVLAAVTGIGLAVLFDLSRFVSMSFFPYAVILQVTPVVAVAPLIQIYVETKLVGLLICSWLVAFFPMISNAATGLRSADHNLRDLYQIYGANRWQVLVHLQLPSALPFILTGLRIAGGLALVGAVVAEYVYGAGGLGFGLASLIQESAYRLNIPGVYAALFLLAATGVTIFVALSALSHVLLHKWHESALRRDR